MPRRNGLLAMALLMPLATFARAADPDMGAMNMINRISGRHIGKCK